MVTGTSAATKPVTADELFEMPDDGYRYELIEGALKQMSPAGGDHGFLAHALGLLLGQHVRGGKLGKVTAAETGFKLREDPDTVRAPDVAFISSERLKQMGSTRGFLSGAPDLAVEVVSPSDTYAEVQDKVRDWLSGGARMVLVVEPDTSTVAVHRPGGPVDILGEDEVLDASEVVPGWKLVVSEAFASLD